MRRSCRGSRKATLFSLLSLPPDFATRKAGHAWGDGPRARRGVAYAPAYAQGASVLIAHLHSPRCLIKATISFTSYVATSTWPSHWQEFRNQPHSRHGASLLQNDRSCVIYEIVRNLSRLIATVDWRIAIVWIFMHLREVSNFEIIVYLYYGKIYTYIYEVNRVYSRAKQFFLFFTFDLSFPRRIAFCSLVLPTQGHPVYKISKVCFLWSSVFYDTNLCKHL